MTEADISNAIKIFQEMMLYMKKNWGADERYKALEVLLSCAEGVAEVLGMKFKEIQDGHTIFMDNVAYNECLYKIQTKLTSHRPNEDAHGTGKEET